MIEPSKVKEAFNGIEAENYAFRAYLKNHANE
ncbi:MAG: Fe-S oxidoreductase, partial [Peptococcaceae bacterium BICA1-8]